MRKSLVNHYLALSTSAFSPKAVYGLFLLFLLLLCSPHIRAENARLLWEISAGKQHGWILGSIHVARPDFYPLPAAVENAFRESTTLAVEIDADDDTINQKMLSFVTYPKGDKLENHLTPATWAKLNILVGGNAESLQQMKPVILSTVLAINSFTALGFSPEAGIDLHFIRRAKSEGKKLVELESAQFQAQLLGTVNDADGDAMLDQTIDSLNNGEAAKQITQMAQAWKTGDLKSLTTLLQEANEKDPASKKMMKILLDDRNPSMAKKIGQLIRTGKQPFVVVGAAHMTGPNSILLLLQKQGFKVRMVP